MIILAEHYHSYRNPELTVLKNLYINYGHTSNGSKHTTGMNALKPYFTNDQYDWSHTGGNNEPHLFEGNGYSYGYLDFDCGYNGWDEETREYLDSFHLHL